MGKRVTSVVVSNLDRPNSAVLAGTNKGIYRLLDDGENLGEVITSPITDHVRWLAIHPHQPEVILAGTEPAGILRSLDGGISWITCLEVSQMRDKYRWYLPYSPEVGCVRGFASHGERVYAAVEVGGVLVSYNSGQSFGLVDGSTGSPNRSPDGFIHPDVHSITVHPSSADLIYAPTGGGFYRSWDGGHSWALRYSCYCRAVWVDPDNPEHMILGPADSVDRNGRIDESFDGGLAWKPASKGLDVPWPRTMVERFLQVDQELLAVLSNGFVFAAQIGEWSWHQSMKEAGFVHALAVFR